MIPRARELLVGGAILEGTLLLGWVPLGPVEDAARWIGILVAGGLLHLFLCARALRSRLPFGRREATIALLLGAIFRLTLVPLEPSLSTDAYRHVWDGRVQATDVDPYLHPPTSPALACVRDAEVWPRINHPELRTVYPPAAQHLARAAAGLHGFLAWTGISGVVAWKGTLLLVELAGAALLAAGLVRIGRGAAFLVYAWSPLAVVEFYGSGHVEAAGVGLLAGAVGLRLLGRHRSAGAFFCAAVLTKWIPAALLLFAGRVKGWRLLLLGATGAASLLLPRYVGAGRAAFESLAAYQSNWSFGGVLHEALRVDAWAAIPRRTIERNFADLLADGNPPEKSWGRAASGALALGAAAWFSWRRRIPVAAAAATGLFAFLLLRPAIHPWYATWLLPLLALTHRPSIHLWTALVPLTYGVLLEYRAAGKWAPDLWVPAGILALVLPLFLREWRPGRVHVPGA